jgi:hypothetical protein
MISGVSGPDACGIRIEAKNLKSVRAHPLDGLAILRPPLRRRFLPDRLIPVPSGVKHPGHVCRLQRIDTLVTIR